jgi:PIN domain nuclease of toxin-antitoxin system
LWLSPITTWELIILCQKGRLFLNRPTAEWIADKLATVPVREAPITQQVAMEVDRLQLPHRDPADHFLVATAKVFELILVTSDEHLLNVPEIQVLSNR